MGEFVSLKFDQDAIQVTKIAYYSIYTLKNSDLYWTGWELHWIQHLCLGAAQGVAGAPHASFQQMRKHARRETGPLTK